MIKLFQWPRFFFSKQKNSDFSLTLTVYSFHLYWAVFIICMKLNARFIKSNNIAPWRSTNMPNQTRENSRLLAESSPNTFIYRLNAVTSISREIDKKYNFTFFILLFFILHFQENIYSQPNEVSSSLIPNSFQNKPMWLLHKVNCYGPLDLWYESRFS